MNKIVTIIKKVIIPYCIFAICFIFLYLSLFWLVFIKLELLNVNESEFYRFGIQFLLTAIPVYIFFNKIFLKLEYKYSFYKKEIVYISSIISIGIILTSLQEILLVKTENINNLIVLNDFQKKRKTTYFTLKYYYIDTTKKFTYSDTRISNKGRDFQMFFYLIMPLYDQIADTSNSDNKYYIASSYMKIISNSLNEVDKKTKFNEFKISTLREIEKTNIPKIEYLKLANSFYVEGYKAALFEKLKDDKFNPSRFNFKDPNSKYLTINNSVFFEQVFINKVDITDVRNYKLQLFIFILATLIIFIPFLLKDLEYFKNKRQSNNIKPLDTTNDKIAIIKSNSYNKTKDVIKEFCKSYNEPNTDLTVINLYKFTEDEFVATFLNNTSFDVFCYFVNYLHYAEEKDYKVEIKAWATTKKNDIWITQKSANKKVMLYIPKEDDEFDNVYLTTEDNIGYKLGFGSRNKLLKEPIISFEEPNISFVNLKNLPKVEIS